MFKEKFEMNRDGNKKYKSNCLAIKNPELTMEWHPNKNTSTPYDFASNSNKKVWWLGKCGHGWESVISSRNKGVGCPYCTGNKVCEDNCLEYLRPDLAKQWHPSKNTTLCPKDVTLHSTKKAWWLCEKGHEWETRVYKRVDGRGCPYCAGKKVDESNSLMKLRPEIAEQWCYEKNKDLTPNDVTVGSNKKFWWICSKKHLWESSVNSRIRGRDCPYCSGQKVCEDNSLVNLFPNIAAEWHPTNNGNLKVHNFSFGSGKLIWWKCKEGHEWKSRICNRTHYETGCPVCNESKGEKAIRDHLVRFKYNFKPQYTFKGLVGLGGNLLKFDFAIRDKKNKLICLIEYDGEFHFGKIYKDDGHETTKIHDELKDNYCKQHNIPLIRIPYWDFNRIEEILNEELK